MKFLSNILIKAGLLVEGTTTLSTIANASTDTDRFIVSDSGVIKYRTGSQILSDIGAADDSLVVHKAGSETITGLKTFNLGISLPNYAPILLSNGARIEGYDGKVLFRTVYGTAGYFENNSLYLAQMDNDASTAGIGVLVKTFGTESKVSYKTAAQMLTFIGAQGSLILTTTGSSGAATLVSNTLNIPNYTLSGLGGVPSSRTLTINGTALDLSANRSWSVGTVTSVGLTVPTGFSVSNSPITSSGDIAIAFAAGYSLPTTASQANWDTAYNNRITSLTTTGTSGAATLVSNTLNIPQYQAQGNYITSLTGEATASGPGAASVTLTNSAVIGKVLTGLNVTGGSVVSTDTILTAFGKLQNQVNGLAGGVTYQGTWDANANSPALASSVGTKGYYYVVSVAGSTNLNGITDWKLGDWAIFNGTSWEKMDNTDAVVSVNGFTGAVSLTTTNISEGTNLYYTDARARLAISLTTTGSSGAATYNNISGALNIPQYTLSGLGGVPTTRTLTINGTALDLSLDRSWSVGTVTSVAALTLGTTGTDLSSSVANGTTTPVITLNVPTASATNRGALSSTDWSTFNNKQNAITLTTTGTSGAATLVGNTLNIPNYAPDLSGYVPTSRTITINGTTQDLTANRTYNVGTVTSVAASAGTGISISGSPITSSGTITITNTAPDQVVALTAGTGISVSGTYPNFTITNSSPSLGGTVTSVALSAPTGFAVTGSPITSSGTLALAFASGYSLPTTASQSNWNSAYDNMIVSAAVTGTTTKTLTLTQQDAGTITASWSDLNTDAVTSVFGRTGAVVAANGDYTTAQVTESGNLYYTDARARASLSAGTGISYSSATGVISSTITQYTDALARAAISLTTTGSSGAATYSSSTGVLNIPTYTLAGLGGISLTSLNALAPLSYNNTTGAFSIALATASTDGYLRFQDWNFFADKIGGSGTTNYIPKFTSSSAIGNSIIVEDNNGNIGIGINPATYPGSNIRVLDVRGSSQGWGLFGSGTTTAQIVGDNLNSEVKIGSYTNSLVAFTINDASRMRLNTNGELIINNTTDVGDFKLQVTGNVYASGNLGLGTSSPDGKLDIAQAMTNGSTSAFTTPHLALTATSTTDNTGFVGMTFATSDNANYGYSYGALRSSGGLGDLIWRQHYNSAQGTELMRLSYSGNLGLGVTPSAWNSAYKALQINSRAALAGDASQTVLANNWFTNTSGTSTYIETAYATAYSQTSGEHRWYNAPSGTANTSISFTQAMTLDASGRLGIGTTIPLARLQVNSEGATTNTLSGAAIVYGTAQADNTTQTEILSLSRPYNAGVSFGTYAALTLGKYDVSVSRGARLNIALSNTSDGADVNVMSLLGNGNVGIGTTSPSGIFHAQATNSGIFFDLSTAYTPKIKASGALSDIQIESVGNGGHVYLNAPGSTSIVAINTNGSERMRITSGGDVGINTQTPNATFHVNGSVAAAISIKTATYTLTSSDYTVVFDLNGNATANLPSATTCSGRIYVIKINRTNVSDVLTIDPNGAQTIDGNATYDLQCQQAITIQSDGSNWRIIGDYAAGVNCL